MITHVSLFSGYGGLDLGLKMAIPDLRTVLYCEFDRYAQGVLISRMRDGGLDPSPIWTDVRTLDGRPWRGCVDIISGGFPCQDVSVAGKRAGVVEGNRSGLWFEYARLIDEIRPSYAFIENVAGLVSNGFDRVLCDLAKMGYDAEWGVVSAAEAGANHRRERLWILAYSKRNGAGREFRNSFGSQRKIQDRPKVCTSQESLTLKTRNGCPPCDATDSDKQYDNGRRESQLPNGQGGDARIELEGVCADVSDTASDRFKKQRESISARPEYSRFERSGWWQTEPAVGRVANGVEYRVDKLRLLGNGVVPQQVALAFSILKERITNGK